MKTLLIYRKLKYFSITVYSESRGGSEFDYVDNFDSKMLLRVPVNASSYQTEGTPESKQEI